MGLLFEEADEGAADDNFVDEGIEDASEDGDLAVFSGEVAIEGICGGGEDEEGGGGDPEVAGGDEGEESESEEESGCRDEVGQVEHMPSEHGLPSRGLGCGGT
ncbi:MAG: hypothetical protein RL215_1617 [Planctomycetota bacterium]